MCSVWRSCGRIRGAPDCTGGGFRRRLWREPARGKRGNLGRNVFVPPQDEALVFCGRNAAHSGLPGGTCNLSGALICFITNCYRRYVFSD